MRLEDMTEPELTNLMTTCAKRIEGVFKEHRLDKPLFALLVFNDPAVAQYISNCRREDMARAFREGAERIEKSEDIHRG